MSRRPSPGPELVWAPWRIQYVKDESAGGFEGPECVFCDLPAQQDDARSYILHRGARAYVVMNLYPYNNGHVMTVPYEHTDTLRALDGETLAEVMQLTQRAQAALEEALRPQGFNLGINQGAAAGAGIADHLHLHLVPRWVGDTNFMPALGDTRVIPQHVDETYALLRGAFVR